MGDYCRCYTYGRKKRNAIARSKEINIFLKETTDWAEIKLLLLGSAESGKSTFMKQMRIIHGSGYSEDERRGYTKLVFQNIFQAVRSITYAMNTLKIPYSNPQNEIYAQQLQDLDIEQITQLQRNYVDAIHHLWADRGFMICYKRHREYQLLDSTEYFIDNLDRIAAEDYIPTYQDILHVRSPTNSITEQWISMKTLTLRFIDVGGLKGQRRKWIHYFEDVTSVLFIASLSEYDQFLEGNKMVNRMEESLSLFHTTIHSTWFAKTSIILFLNKMDILAEKIRYSDLKTYFPGFEGKPRAETDAMEFIQELYKQKTVTSERELFRSIYSHFICATDTIDINMLFRTITDIIICQTLSEFKSL